MDFRILGPFEATDDTGPVKLTGGKQKALLALLLLHADRVVPMDRLVDDLWGDEVPESAQKMVQIFVSQLRKQLPDELLRTRAPGYLVELDGHSLDLRRFEELHAGGREALARVEPTRPPRHSAERSSSGAGRPLRSSRNRSRGSRKPDLPSSTSPASRSASRRI